ncbi:MULTISPECIES: DoxX family protein [unclassified Duganella]|uniref:DoxX family protein n=1 Tax=unclassified Duganella TaxID=2636909 RepID=UPI000701F272|nr:MULTISPECIES: DoxX family protein [unclassified Duganella]KQV59801.1 LysR family transcriptional regulator [Duganella sp. Root336D2]KRB87280.1 LysR family transcriptional regulator [Duganella sp. Root198D2]
MNNQTNTSILPLAGRILMAAIFVMSGIGKIANPGATLGYINAMGLPFPELALAGAIGIELVGGLLLIAGLYTRPVALALAAFSIVTGLIFHSAIADQNQMIHLMKNLAMAGGLLQIAAFGAGSLSIDARRTPGTLRTA